MEFAPVEIAVRELFGKREVGPTLCTAIQRARPLERRSGQHSMFIKLEVPTVRMSATERSDTNPIPGPFIHSPKFP